MKKILLVSTRVLHYRIRIYNYFYDEFSKHGIDFAVLSHNIQDVEDRQGILHLPLHNELHSHIADPLCIFKN